MSDLQSKINDTFGDLGASNLKKYSSGTSPMVSGSQFWNDLYNTAVNVGNSITNSFSKAPTTTQTSSPQTYNSLNGLTYDASGLKLPFEIPQVIGNKQPVFTNQPIGSTPFVQPEKVNVKEPVTTSSYGSNALNTNDLTPNVNNSYSQTNTENQNNINASYTSSNANNVVNQSTESNFDKYLAAIGKVPQVNESNIRAKAEADSALAEKTKISNNLKAKIDANTASAEVAKQTLESQASGRDVTTGFLGRQQQEIDRRVLIQNVPLITQYQIANGDTEAAQKTVDSAVKSEVDYEKSQYDYQTKLIDKALEYANEKDKAIIAAQKERVDNNYRNSQALWQKKLDILSLAQKSGDLSNIGNIISSNNSNTLDSLASNLISSNKDTDVLKQYVKDVQATPENFNSVPTAYKEAVAEKLGGATLPDYKSTNLGFKTNMSKEFDSVGITKDNYQSVKQLLDSGSTLSSILSVSQGISEQAKQVFEKYLKLKE